ADFDVLASYGHVRDLVPKEGAVDPDNGYAMKYQVLEKNERHVETIARTLRKSKALYLATDPDREGEAIAWHLSEILKSRGDLGVRCSGILDHRRRRLPQRAGLPAQAQRVSRHEGRAVQLHQRGAGARGRARDRGGRAGGRRRRRSGPTARPRDRPQAAPAP